MNGIAGVLHLDGDPVEPSLLHAPMRAMAHGGDPRPETVVLGAVGFARHSPVDGNATLAPQVFARGNIAVVADARLDGRDALCDALDVPAAARDTITEAELLLGSYERWGNACPEHLIGDYAFAIWDGTRRTLLCARDHVGARPFYYALVGKRFVFASEIQGVLAFAGVPAQIDEAEVARFLLHETRRYREPAHTFFAHVRMLPFGHRMHVDSTGVREERYWRPEQLPEVRLRSADDYAQRLFELVNEALSDRLRGARHVGVHLSGGIDSSSLAVIAARTTRGRGVGLTAFSWSPPPGEDSMRAEHERIAVVTRAEGIVPMYVPPQLSSYWRFDRDIAISPRYDTLAERPVVDAAAAGGVDVMVSGWGGDEAASYNGRGIAAGHLASGAWGALARHCWERGGRSGDRRLLRHLGASASVFWSAACRPWMPEPAFRLLGRRSRPVGSSLIAPHFLRRVRPHVRPPIAPIRDVPGGRANMLRLYYGAVVSDRLAAWRVFRAERNVTHVYPLTDRRILEFIYGAPSDLHVQRGVARFLFRQAMSSVVPELAWGPTKYEGGSKPPSLASCADERGRLLAALEAPFTPVPHPWVDIERLRRAVAVAPDNAGPSVHVDHALSALTVWRNWCGERR